MAIIKFVSEKKEIQVPDAVVQTEKSAAKEFLTVRSPADTSSKISEHLQKKFPEAKFKEQGVDIELASLRGVAAPKGLPEPVRKKLVDALAAISADPAFKQQAEAMFAPIRYLAPTAYAGELERGEAGFKKLWGEMPWQDKP